LPSCAAERALQHVHREASIFVKEHAAKRRVAPGHVEQLLVEGLPFDWSMSEGVDACCAAAGPDDSTAAATIAKAIPVAQIARDFIVWVPVECNLNIGQDKKKN
jgi:hypothetical protein